MQYHGNQSLRCPKAQNDKRSGIGQGGSDLPSTKNFSKTHPYKKMNSFPENGKNFLGVLPHQSFHFNYLIVIQLLSYFWEMLFVFMSPLRQTISCYLPSKNIHFAKSN